MVKVLLIEDDLPIRENLSEILELAGFDMIVAADGHAGLMKAVQDKPDVVVCDVMMPNMDGYEVLAAMRQGAVTASTPFIFISARSEKKEIEKGLNAGANAYLCKPFDATKLIGIINRCLNARG